MDNNILTLLKDLTNAFGPSGFEDDVINVIKEKANFIDSERDSINNLYLGLEKIDKTIKQNIPMGYSIHKKVLILFLILKNSMNS